MTAIAALCRHGAYHQPPATPSAHLLYPLTPEGQQQARTLADRLHALTLERGWALDPVIDASPLQRAYQTAAIAAEGLSRLVGKPFVIEQFEALTERCVGAAANLSVDEIERILEQDERFESPPADWKASSDYRLPFPGSESMRDAGVRCAEHLRHRMGGLDADQRPPRLKIFVGHGGAFRHAALDLGALGPDEVSARSMYHARPVCLSVNARQAWALVAGDWKLRTGVQAMD